MDYVDTGSGMGREATLYLLNRGVRVTGTDAWSWDAPFVHTAKKYAATGDASLIWEGHKAGREIGYCHLEKLHNLEALPAKGFMVSCLPVKIRGASAGWTPGRGDHRFGVNARGIRSPCIERQTNWYSRVFVRLEPIQ